MCCCTYLHYTSLILFLCLGQEEGGIQSIFICSRLASFFLYLLFGSLYFIFSIFNLILFSFYVIFICILFLLLFSFFIYFIYFLSFVPIFSIFRSFIYNICIFLPPICVFYIGFLLGKLC